MVSSRNSRKHCDRSGWSSWFCAAVDVGGGSRLATRAPVVVSTGSAYAPMSCFCHCHPFHSHPPTLYTLPRTQLSFKTVNGVLACCKDYTISRLRMLEINQFYHKISIDHLDTGAYFITSLRNFLEKYLVSTIRMKIRTKQQT